jgi:hypothetical protein
VELGNILWWSVPTIKKFEGKWERLEEFYQETQDELVKRLAHPVSSVKTNDRWSKFETTELVELGNILWWSVPIIANRDGKCERLAKIDKEIQDELDKRDQD